MPSLFLYQNSHVKNRFGIHLLIDLGIRFFLSIFLLVLLGLTQLFGQTCLQKLDSASHHKYLNSEKAKYYAKSLLVDLDSNRCNVDIGIAGMYNNLGLLLWEINEKKDGLDALLKGLSQQLNVLDSTDVELLGIYYNLSAMYQEMGDFQSAGEFINYAGKSVSLFEGYEKEDITLSYMLRKGTFHREIGQFGESIEVLSEALSFPEAQDSIKIALQIELGTTYRYAGNLDQGEIELIKAMEMAEGVSERQYLLAIDRLSSLKMEQGEYSDSENFLLFNLKNKEGVASPISKLETLNVLGILYYKLNDFQSSEKYLIEALQIGKGIRNIRPYLINNLGTLYLKQGDLEKAESHFLESSEGFKQLFGIINPDYASSLSNLAGVYKQQGRLSEALNLYTKVLDMDKVIFGEKNPRYATSLNNVALLYLALKNTSLAGKLLETAKNIRQASLGDYHPSTIKSMNDLGIYYLLEKDTTSSLGIFDQSLEAEIKHMKEIFPVLTDNQRQLYFGQARSNVERYCSLVFNSQSKSSSHFEKALNHFINTKGILFYASQKMRDLVSSSDDKKLLKIYDEWRETKYKLAQAYLLSEEQRTLQSISIPSLESRAQEMEKTLSLEFKVFADQESASYHNWNEIGAALPDSAAMIDIIQYRDYSVKIVDDAIAQGFEDRSNYVAYVILSESQLETVTWSRYVDFDRSFSQYMNSLKYNIKDVTSYETFWKPLDEVLAGIKRVYFSPDGIYHKLNPSIFYNPKKNEYVADVYDILNVTSGKDLLIPTNSDFKRSAMIFGNPDFSNLSMADQLSQLPGAEREAQDITEILDVRKWKTKTYYYQDVTEDQVKQVNNPGIVHLATHGYFEEDPENSNPLYSSGLYLSKAVNSTNDGLLSAYEAMNLVLDNTNVVVLAACETGLGTIQNGEGVFGLQRAFLVAGAENVLISLVKINDNAARTFMNLFYEELKEEENAQKAFFDARATFKQLDTNPYNWGAYVLVSRG